MVGRLSGCRSSRSVAGLASDGRFETCRIKAWQVVGRQAVARLDSQRHAQLAGSDKVVTWLAAMGRNGCRFNDLVFTAAAQRSTCCPGVNNMQTRSQRLGPGLMASAPHHRPRGLLHPHERQRLDFVSADDPFVACFPLEFLGCSRCERLAHVACMPSHVRSLSRPSLPRVARGCLCFTNARSTAREAAGGRDAPRAGAGTVHTTTTHRVVGGRRVEFSSS